MTLVFLDLDGTLIDPKPGITGAIVAAMGALGLPAPDPDEITWAIGPPLWGSFARLGVPDARLDEAVAAYRARFTANGLFEARVYDGIPRALADLRAAGHRLALCTSKPLAYAPRITAHFGLEQYLDAQFGSELDGTRAEKGPLIAHALREMGAARAVMIGDRRYDVEGAARNGLPTIGVLWGYGGQAELAAAGAAAFARAPGDLPALVAKLSG